MYKIIGVDGKEYGPVSLAQVRQWLSEGRANAQTRILPDGVTDWKTVGELPEFAAPSGSGPTPQPIRPVTPQPTTYRPQQTNGLAVTGLIFGIISLVISFCCCGGLPLNLIGIVLSAIALAQINKRPDLYTGRGVAIAGLILSALSLLLGVGVLVLSAAFNWDEIARKIQRL
jgi:Domain of unknown function (DUF4190)/GYF domain 2